jgi:hypothetical protein
VGLAVVLAAYLAFGIGQAVYRLAQALATPTDAERAAQTE